MNSLINIVEQYCNGYKVEWLSIISLVSILAGIFTIISKNPIISILFLICLFLSIACYLIMIGISFIGLSYLLVYIGAVSILFLFILMLINIRVSELQTENTNSLGLALILSISFYYMVYDLIPQNVYINSFMTNMFNVFNFNNEKLLYVTSGMWDNILVENSHIASIGNVIYSSHFILLIITSIILLLAMVGSIVITYRS